MAKSFLKSGKIFLVTALCFLITGLTLIVPVSASASEVKNEILTLSVQDNPEESAYASFMLRKAGDDVADTLTYAQFYSSYTVVNINGVSHRYSDGEVVTPAYVAQDGSIVTVQNFDGVAITQRLLLTTGNSSKEDMLLIHYSAKNNTESDVLFSVKVVIDPTIAKSETDMVKVDGVSYNTEKTFSGEEISDTWSITDYDSNILAYGILDIDLEMPDKFQIADWKNLYDYKGSYQTSNRNVIIDNAVAVIWENRSVASQAKVDFGTKYGLYSEDEIIVTEPTTEEPTTVAPTTVAPTTVAPTTVAPTTVAPTTVAPTTVAPTTVAPTTVAPTTVAPTTVAPTTVAPTTVAPTTVAPTTVEPTEVESTNAEVTTVAPTQDTTQQVTTKPFVNPDSYAPKTGSPFRMFGAVMMLVASGVSMFIYSKKRREN